MRGSDFDLYQKNQDTISDAIRTNMRDIRNENREDWGEITDSVIDTESTDDKVYETIAQMSKNLVLRRKRLFDRSMELFPTISDQGNNWKMNLVASIHRYDEDELHNLITRTPALRKMLYETFP
jgi:hypothetical protein